MEDYRQRVTDALRELAAVRGFCGVTVDELAAHTGISKRTIYRYFKNKEEMVNSVLEDFISSVEQKITEALNSSDDPVEMITNTIKVLIENIKMLQPVALHDLQKYYPHLWEKIERFRAGKIHQIFGKILLENKNRLFREINPDIITVALLASVRAVVNPSFIMENNLSPEETINSLFTIFLHGIVRQAPGQ